MHRTRHSVVCRICQADRSAKRQFGQLQWLYGLCAPAATDCGTASKLLMTELWRGGCSSLSGAHPTCRRRLYSWCCSWVTWVPSLLWRGRRGAALPPLPWHVHKRQWASVTLVKHQHCYGPAPQRSAAVACRAQCGWLVWPAAPQHATNTTALMCNQPGRGYDGRHGSRAAFRQAAPGRKH